MASLLRRATAAALAVSAGLVLVAGPAGAHAELIRSDPAVNDTVDDGLDEIELVFTPLSQEGELRVTVLGPDGDDVTTGPAFLRGDSTVVAPIEPAVEGRYTVDYTVTGADLDTTGGTFVFDVDSTSTSNVALIVLWAVALALPAAFLLRGRRSKGGARRPTTRSRRR